ncbi:DEKNAAC100358 [Brettanomyces naardenensis]|uniref:pH-response regulator protein palF/RIM8 n=1 Tax=Brettanomyces naardenensis TaxID=13370 RepID=A0A448YEX7_BRENA|nr:DEKNAAC100358 [Brettanomyces naardenensis]
MRRAVHQILPLKGPRILSSTFGSSRTKSAIKEFYILLDPAHKTYRSGDEVSGQIILILDRNVPDILIKLGLMGVIKIHSSSPLRSDKKEYLFNHSVVLYGDAAKNELALTKGEHRFPFIVKLPKKNIHTSISFEKGEIKYSLKSDICNRSAGNNVKLMTSEMLLNIVKPINLALLPDAQPKTLTFHSNKRNMRHVASSTSSINSTDSFELQPTNHSTTSTPGATVGDHYNLYNPVDSSNEIKIRMDIPFVGYLKGESIPVKLSIKHYKKIANVNGIFITLIRICSLDMGEDYELQSFRKDLAQSIVPLIVDPSSKTTYEVSTSLKVPLDSFPTIVSSLVSFQYYIEVLVNMSNSSRLQGPQKNELVDDEIIQLGSADTIYNVDKLKQMKNVLTLTSEIIIGTERKPISKLKTRHRAALSSSHGSISQPTTPLSNVQSTRTISSSPSPVGHSESEELRRPSSLHDSPESPDTPTQHIDSLSSSGVSMAAHSVTASRSSNASVNSPLAILSMPSPPSVRNANSTQEEKELLHLREQALLPSQPPLSSSESYTSPPSEPPPPPSPPISPDGNRYGYLPSYPSDGNGNVEYSPLPAYSEIDHNRWKENRQMIPQTVTMRTNNDGNDSSNNAGTTSNHSIETITTDRNN